MTIEADHPDVQLMAILGACIAATLFVLGWGVFGVVDLILNGQPVRGELWGIPAFLVVAFAFGVVIALLTAFPLGLLYGRVLLRFVAPSMGVAALTGALTGATLIAVVAVLGEGSRELWEPVSLFAALGAVSGALAFQLVMRWDQSGRPE